MMSKIFFAHPHTLLDMAWKMTQEIGPQKFFTSPEEEVKKRREGFAAYFFTLALKKLTKQDWWVAQFDQNERRYPDFDLISFSEKIEETKIEPVELTGVYPHFKDFEEMMSVVKKKTKQYGEKPLNFSLLIFVNHEKSEEWIQTLKEWLKTPQPFLSIWTIHLLFKKGGKEVGKAVAQKIQPVPGLRIEVNTDDQEIHKRQPIPHYLEIKEEKSFVYVTFKSDSIDRIRNMKKSNLKS